MQSLSAVQTCSGAYGQFRKRWLNGALSQQSSIKMPAMSPLMTEGTIARWNKQEGDAFVQGDVLVQIQLELDTFNVEAQSSGIMGKILSPDGTRNVPVEQVIALVAQDATALGQIHNDQLNLSSPSIYISVDSPSVSPKSIPTANTDFLSPGYFALALSSPRTPTKVPRTPTQGAYALTVVSGLAVKAARVRPRLLRLGALSSKGDLLISCPSPRCPSSAAIPSPFRTQLQEDVATTPLPSTPLTAKWPGSAILRSALVSQALSNKSYIPRSPAPVCFEGTILS